MKASAARIPPESEQLEFARNTKTGCVHILCRGPGRRWAPPTRENEDPLSFSGVVHDALLAPSRMLCGAKLLVGPFENLPAVWVGGDHFADDDFCIACVQALGDQSWRAFHPDNRAPCPDDD